MTLGYDQPLYFLPSITGGRSRLGFLDGRATTPRKRSA